MRKLKCRQVAGLRQATCRQAPDRARAEKLFYRDSEHHGCGLAVERRFLPVLDHAPERRTFLPQFVERIVPLDVIGQEDGSVPKMGPRYFELAAHVPAGVQAVVY